MMVAPRPVKACILPFPHEKPFVIDGDDTKTFEFVVTEAVKPAKLVIPAQFAFAFDVIDIAYRANKEEKIYSFFQGRGSVPAAVFTEGCMLYPHLFTVSMLPEDKIFLKIRNRDTIKQPFSAAFIGTPPG